ncbi:MAG TPA: hypothetical protein VFC78_06970 [Tepidisphaeraceae bacterium]|nr:hypothetical protein [Tepidisphaeraceae bacterium]
MRNLFALLISVSTLCGARPSDESPRPATAPVSQHYFDRLVGNIVLGKVIRAKERPLPGYRIGFEVETLCDYRGEAKGRITVMGNPADQFTNNNSMPDLPVDRMVLVSIFPLAHAGEFGCADWRFAPFGLQTPREVAPKEIEPIKQAITELRRLAPPNGKGPIPREEVERLLNSKDYLQWALGATLLAYEGTPKDINALMGALNVGNLTVKQAIWVHYILRQIAPEKTRPPAWDLDQTYSGYFESRSPEFKILDDWTPGSPERAKPSKSK